MNTKLTSTLLALVTVAGVDMATARELELKTTPPKNVNLTAIWQINTEQSDDPQEVLSGKRDESRSRTPPTPSRRGSTKAGPFDVDVGDVFGNGTTSGSVVIGRRPTGGDNSDRPDEDPEPTNTRVPLDSFMATREQFEIQQQPEGFTIRTVDESNTCKPGETSKVPLQSGEMVDQRCGWDGAAFVVEVKSPDGVTRTNRYQTQDGGKRLIMVSEIKGGRGKLRGLHIRRVYDRLY